MTVWQLSPKQLGYVQLITRLAVDNGLGRQGAVYAVACSGAEASLMNWENWGRSTHVARGGRINGRQLNAAERRMCLRSKGLGDGAPDWGDNLDSMGLFAQRPTEGWGDPEQIMQPQLATKAFLGRLAAVKGWATMPAAEVIRRVQGYHSDIYTDWLATADAVVSRTVITTPRKDWFDMATLQDLDNALDKLATARQTNAMHIAAIAAFDGAPVATLNAELDRALAPPSSPSRRSSRTAR